MQDKLLLDKNTKKSYSNNEKDMKNHVFAGQVGKQHLKQMKNK